MAEIDAYVRRVEASLAFDADAAERASFEIADHLYESASRVGEAEAVARFGDASIVIRGFAIRSLHGAIRSLAAYAAIGVAATFAAMEVRTTFLAVHGASIFRGDRALFSIDAAGFIVAAGATALAFLAMCTRSRRATIPLFIIAMGGLALSIVAELLATGAHVRAHGAFAFFAALAAGFETIATAVVLSATSRLAKRAARAGALLTHISP